MDKAFNNPPILGDEFICNNPKLHHRYGMSTYKIKSSKVTDGLGLIQEDYHCEGHYLRLYYLTD